MVTVTTSEAIDVSKLRTQLIALLQTELEGHNLLRTIHLVGELGSYRAACRPLCLSHPTNVRRRVVALAAILGVELVTRSDNGGVLLSPVGEAVALMARDVVAGWVQSDECVAWAR